MHALLLSHQYSDLPFVYVIILSKSQLWRIRETNPLGKTSKILFWIMPTFGKSCHRPWLHGLKNQSEVGSLCKFSKMAAAWTACRHWAGNTTENFPFLTVETCLICLNQICLFFNSFNVESMLIMVRYFNKICGINPSRITSHVTQSSSPAPEHAQQFPGIISCFHMAPNSGPTRKSLLTPEFRLVLDLFKALPAKSYGLVTCVIMSQLPEIS